MCCVDVSQMSSRKIVATTRVRYEDRTPASSASLLIISSYEVRASLNSVRENKSQLSAIFGDFELRVPNGSG